MDEKAKILKVLLTIGMFYILSVKIDSLNKVKSSKLTGVKYSINAHEENAFFLKSTKNFDNHMGQALKEIYL